MEQLITSDMEEGNLIFLMEQLTQEISGLSSRLERIELTVPEVRRWVNTKEAADILGVSESRIYALKSAGRLTPVRKGRQFYFDSTQVKSLKYGTAVQ